MPGGCRSICYLVVTNLFRDSLKRNAHPDYIFSVINTYCPDTTKLILNADELCSSMLKPNNERVFFGIGKQPGDLTQSINIVSDYSLCPKCGTPLEYDYLRYHHIGHAHCPACDFHSQDAQFLATNVDTKNMVLTMNVRGEQVDFPLISDILFNIYNEVTVITTLLEVGIPVHQVQAMSKGQSCISSCRTFDYVSSQPGKKAIILSMDDAYDRKQSIEYVGWIYDVDYEFLTREGVEQVIATGPRCYDHKVRLLLAGVPEEKICCAQDEMSGVDMVQTDKVDAVYILYDTSTYTLSCQMKEKLLKKLEGTK